MRTLPHDSIDRTHDRSAKSWLPSANDARTDFPIQNLPYGIFRAAPEGPFRVGIAIGDRVLDLAAIAALLPGEAADIALAACGENLNALMALGPEAATTLRRSLFDLFVDERRAATVEPHCLLLTSVELGVPATIGDYTDFYASIFHASNVGALFRPDAPLLPNYRYIPIGYNGRSSSIVVSGTSIRRPWGQRKVAGVSDPQFLPSARLDYETEIGWYIGQDTRGHRRSVDDSESHIFGLTLLNDWSARDIQAWEYQPLGPFLGKSFGTTVSPWIVTRDALAPFRVPAFLRAAGDPQALPHLHSPVDEMHGGYDVTVSTELSTTAMRAAGAAPIVIGRGKLAEMYWTLAQMTAHHTSNGTPLRSGDLLGTGTISGSTMGSLGSFIEISRNGVEPLVLPNGEERCFLEDGDQVTLRGRCTRDGFAEIGFGECRGEIIPAL